MSQSGGVHLANFFLRLIIDVETIYTLIIQSSKVPIEKNGLN